MGDLATTTTNTIRVLIQGYEVQKMHLGYDPSSKKWQRILITTQLLRTAQEFPLSYTIGAHQRLGIFFAIHNTTLV